MFETEKVKNISGERSDTEKRVQKFNLLSQKMFHPHCWRKKASVTKSQLREKFLTSTKIIL